MPKSYPQEAVDLCLTLYLKYGGQNFDAVQREMKREYPAWSKGLLHSKGTGKDARLGWMDKYGWQNALKLHLENKVERVQNDTQKLYQDIKTIRETLAKKAKSLDATATDLQLFAKYCELEIKARQTLELSKSNLETFADSYELICSWLPDVDAAVGKGFLKCGDKLIQMAEVHYGKAEQSKNE
jgi:hypothetical protein